MLFKTLKFRDAFTEPVRGRSGLTKSYIQNHPGQYPVYSASTIGPMGAIASYDYDGDYLSWSSNGYAGTIRVLHEKFSTNADRSMSTPKIPGLNLEYCRLLLEPEFRLLAHGRIVDGKKNEYTKLSPEDVLDVEFLVPYLETGEIDEKYQESFVSRFAKIRGFQERAEDLAKLIAAVRPKPDLDDRATREVFLTDSDYFEFVPVKTYWTKAQYHLYDTGNPSDSPLYSAAKTPIAYVNSEHPKRIDASPAARVVSFGSDGEGSAGTNFVVHNRPFYVTDKRSCVRIKDRNIDADFVRHALKTMKSDYGFGFHYKATVQHLADVTVPIPVDNNGNFDLPKQLDTVARLNHLEDVRDRTLTLLARITSARVLASTD